MLLTRGRGSMTNKSGEEGTGFCNLWIDAAVTLRHCNIDGEACQWHLGRYLSVRVRVWREVQLPSAQDLILL